jgi:hypothetical protein
MASARHAGVQIFIDTDVPDVINYIGCPREAPTAAF